MLAAVVGLRLEGFTGLRAGTTRSHVVQAAGPVIAEGFGGGAIPLWMTVHQLSPVIRLTAWYALADDAAEPGVGPDHPVLWIERPIQPSEVTALLDLPARHQPARAGHLMAWPERGLCLRFSRRSRLPTLLLAFAPMSHDAFDRSPMATRD
jgi:hypothetical protein